MKNPVNKALVYLFHSDESNLDKESYKKYATTSRIYIFNAEAICR